MIQDPVRFCDLFYRASFLPITCCCRGTGEVSFFPRASGIDRLVHSTLPGFMHFTQNPDYFVADSFSYFGFIDSLSSDYCIILGPVFSTPVTQAGIHAFMSEWAVSSEYRTTVIQFLESIPQLSFHQFLQTLTYLYFCVNDRAISAAEHFHLEDTSRIDQISGVHTEQRMDSKENQKLHNTYYFEGEMLRCVQDGKIDQLQALLNGDKPLSQGTMADNALRQEKDIFISTVTLTSRNAILGGMDIEQAYQLSDVYVQECEKSQSIYEVSNLSYAMLMDFTKRVSENRIPGGMSKEVSDCVQFISRNINTPIQVGDVAAHAGKSRSGLTRMFKEELGFDISSFIMRCRLEEAKSLLTFSEKSLSEISSYLCFSSQAYFQNVFRKKYGVTPMQYRKKTARI